MTTHTPGPWIAEQEVFAPGGIVGIYVAQYDARVQEPGGRICQAYGNCLVTTDETVRANARLIAAAPDLLAALKAVVESWETGTRWRDEMGRARAAIAKAEGK